MAFVGPFFDLHHCQSRQSSCPELWLVASCWCQLSEIDSTGVAQRLLNCQEKLGKDRFNMYKNGVQHVSKCATREVISIQRLRVRNGLLSVRHLVFHPKVGWLLDASFTIFSVPKEPWIQKIDKVTMNPEPPFLPISKFVDLLIISFKLGEMWLEMWLEMW